MQMMSRFSALILALCATTAQAERALDRQETIGLMKTNAICYLDYDDTCYGTEFYDNVRQDTVDVTYTYDGDGFMYVVTERATWDGARVCVPAGSVGVVQAWRVMAPDRTFRFDVSNGIPIKGQEYADLLALYDGREEGYCYGFATDDAVPQTFTSYRDFMSQDNLMPMRPVPFTDEFVTVP